MTTAVHPRTITLRRHQILLDRLVMRTWATQLEGRFWGIAGVLSLLAGFSISFAIDPGLLTPSGAFSDFGSNIRTAPYFTSSLLLAGYCLRRWRSYVVQTLRHSRGMNLLISLEIISLTLIALMPYAWQPGPSRIHMFAVALLGASITVSLLLDRALTLPHKAVHGWRRLINAGAFVSVLSGDVIIFGSNAVHWLDITLPGETLLLLGYGCWIVLKTFSFVDQPRKVSSLLRNLMPDS